MVACMDVEKRIFHLEPAEPLQALSGSTITMQGYSQKEEQETGLLSWLGRSW
jgi:hypothetical protein